MSAPQIASAEFATATTLVEAIAARRISARDVAQGSIDRINRLNPRLNAFIGLNPRALDEAREADRKVARGTRSPLLGVPIAVKDLILGRDAPTTAGSRIFGDGLVSDHDAPVIQRLRRAGAVIIGRTNLHEVALGVTNENDHFGAARNPWDPARVPGGSSGGSAIAVSAGLCSLALGSDTRGSIRIPAAFCGVTGFKPTYGSVPTEDVIPLSWSLDHVGPMARSVEDAALMLGVLVGGRAALRYRAAVDAPVGGLRLGICEYFLHDLEPDIERAVLAAIQVFRDAGVTVREVSLPGIEHSHGASATITLAEAVTYHDSALKEHPGGFGKSVRARLEKGYQLSALDLVRAHRLKQEISAAFDRVWTDCDYLIGATVPALPTLIGESALRLRDRETTALAEFPRLTAPANLAGVPALSLPCGISSGGLPIGLQVMAPRGRDDVVLSVGAHYQRETDWHQRHPALSASDGSR